MIETAQMPYRFVVVNLDVKDGASAAHLVNAQQRRTCNMRPPRLRKQTLTLQLRPFMARFALDRRG